MICTIDLRVDNGAFRSKSSDPGWGNPAAREELLAPTLSAYRAALVISAAPGRVREFLWEHVRPLQDTGVEGLEPVVAMREEAIAEGGENT